MNTISHSVIDSLGAVRLLSPRRRDDESFFGSGYAGIGSAVAPVKPGHLVLIREPSFGNSKADCIAGLSVSSIFDKGYDTVIDCCLSFCAKATEDGGYWYVK